jgi:hypothetical protein
VIGSRSPRLMSAKKALVLLTLSSLSPTLFAQEKLDREIVFVRALAKDMKFIELAKEEADRLANEYRGAGDQDKIAQLAVQVSYYGARSRNDRALQRTLFKEALEKSKELIDRSSDPGVQLEARSTLADASQDFGQFLIEELEIAHESAPEKVKDLEEEASGVFRSGIEACGKVMEGLQGQRKDESKNTEFLLLWMRKGVLMREQARAVKTDRAVLIERAITELTDMVLDAGEETAIGLRGLFELAQCYEVSGDFAQALDSYKTTISQIATSLDQADELGLSGDIQGLLFEMLQEVSLHAAEVMLSQGATGTAEVFTAFREQMAKHGEKGVDLFDVVDQRWGHLMLLVECRFLAETGDSKKIGEAMAMAQRINDKHPADYVGVKAKAVLRDILAVQRNLVSGKLLFEIAKGEFQNKNYEASIMGLRRSIAVMSPEEQQTMGLEAYQMLGTAYGVTERYLESIIALTEGLQKFGKRDDDRSGETADSLDRAVGQQKRLTKNETAFDGLYDAASQQIAAFSIGGAGKLFWKQGNTLFNDGKYAEAITEYAKIDNTFQFYELAQVRIARAYETLGNFAETRKALSAFRELTSKPPAKKEQQSYRAAAMAHAAYIEALMAYIEARGSEEWKLQRQPTKYPEALAKLREFVANFAKDGEDYIPAALEYIARLHCDLGELDQADQAYIQLKDKDAPRASRVATEIFVEYQARVKTLSEELDQAVAKNKSDAVQKTAQTELDKVRGKLTALGVDYIANSPQPQLAVLVNTMLNYEALEDWKKVDEIAQKTLQIYGNSTADSTKRVVDLVVRPKIGEALLKQRQFTKAYEMLTAAEKANPTQWELKRQIAKALGGWFGFTSTGSPDPVVGLDRAEEAYLKMYTEYRPWAERPEVKKYSLEWYTFYWECYWFAKRASLKDSKYKAIAEKFYNIAKSTDDFATLLAFGAEGKKIRDYFTFNR